VLACPWWVVLGTCHVEAPSRPWACPKVSPPRHPTVLSFSPSGLPLGSISRLLQGTRSTCRGASRDSVPGRPMLFARQLGPPNQDCGWCTMGGFYSTLLVAWPCGSSDVGAWCRATGGKVGVLSGVVPGGSCVRAWPCVPCMSHGSGGRERTGGSGTRYPLGWEDAMRAPRESAGRCSPEVPRRWIASRWERPVRCGLLADEVGAWRRGGTGPGRPAGGVRLFPVVPGEPGAFVFAGGLLPMLGLFLPPGCGPSCPGVPRAGAWRGGGVWVVGGFTRRGANFCVPV